MHRLSLHGTDLLALRSTPELLAGCCGRWGEPNGRVGGAQWPERPLADRSVAQSKEWSEGAGAGPQWGWQNHPPKGHLKSVSTLKATRTVVHFHLLLGMCITQQNPINVELSGQHTVPYKAGKVATVPRRRVVASLLHIYRYIVFSFSCE